MELLVALDLSESTEKIPEKTKNIAIELSAKIYLLHIAEPEPDFIGFEGGPESVRDSLAKTFHDEHCQLQEITDQLRKAGLDTTALLVQGTTAETILKEASKLNIDIIIIGSHGRGAMYQLLVGSVSEGIIKNSKLPVLIIPTHEHS